MNLLRAETDSLPRTELGNYSHSDLAHLEHLNSVINEALRLYPPVPSALQRLTPPEGLTVAGTYIPGNVTIYCPQYVIGRSEIIACPPINSKPMLTTSCRPELLQLPR